MFRNTSRQLLFGLTYIEFLAAFTSIFVSVEPIYQHVDCNLLDLFKSDIF